MLLPCFVLVADGKTTFYSSIMADVMPWWLVLLPLSCKSYLADVIAIVAGVIATFLWLMLLPQWLMLLPLGTFVLADVIAMVADVITTQGVWGCLAGVKANCG